LYHKAPAADIGDVYKESQAYINFDILNHPGDASALLVRGDFPNGYADFYGYAHIPQYTPGNDIDVLYVNPLHWNVNGMNGTLREYHINDENILKVQINDSDFVFKVVFHDK
jgi:hypothetical protein